MLRLLVVRACPFLTAPELGEIAALRCLGSKDAPAAPMRGPRRPLYFFFYRFAGTAGADAQAKQEGRRTQALLELVRQKLPIWLSTPKPLGH